jgi:drug/metabolite transporter (DMT)-like permease
MPEEAPAGTPQKTAGPRWAILFSLLSGAFLAAHFASWITSLSHTSVAHATALVTTHPIVVAALGWLVLGERISLKGVLCMIGAIAGGILLVAGDSGGGESTLYGNLLAVGGAVTAGVYLVIGRYARRHLSLNGYTMIVYWTSFVMLALVTSLRDIPLWPYPVREFLIFAALAIFCTLLGHSLFNWALAFLPSTVVSTSILGEPIIATVLALFLFAEVPGPVTAAGSAIMLVSIFLYVRDHTSAGRQARVRDARRS